MRGADTLPDQTPVQLFCEEELEVIEQELRTLLDLQMPSFVRGDEDEDAGDFFYQPPHTTTPA